MYKELLLVTVFFLEGCDKLFLAYSRSVYCQINHAQDSMMLQTSQTIDAV